MTLVALGAIGVALEMICLFSPKEWVAMEIVAVPLLPNDRIGDILEDY